MKVVRNSRIKEDESVDVNMATTEERFDLADLQIFGGRVIRRNCFHIGYQEKYYIEGRQYV